MTAALGTVTCALVLAIGRDPLPSPLHPVGIPAPPPIAPPEPLPRSDEVEALRNGADPEAAGDLRNTRRITLPVHVANAPEPLRANGGVATFHRVTGGDFRWHALADADAADDGSLLIHADAVIGSALTVTFAASRAHARHGYLARVDVDVARHADSGTAAPIALDGSVHRVRFDLPESVDRAGPLRLQRIDDRQWLPMLHSTAGLTLARGTELELELGKGDYELQDPLAPERAQQFAVPGSDSITIAPELAPARDGQP